MVYKDKYCSLGLSIQLSRRITGTESENKECTMAYCEEGIFKGYRPRSPSIAFRAISPLNTPPADAAPAIRLHNFTEYGAEELEWGARKRIPTDKGKKYQRL